MHIGRLGFAALFSVMGSASASPTSFSRQGLDGIPGSFEGWMNDHRQIAIGSILWDSGQIVNLGHFGGNFTVVEGINNAGQVVGRSRSANFDMHPFVWQNGVMTPLPKLGGEEGYATDISENGKIVGYTDFIPGSSVVEFRATLWDTPSTPRDLGTLGSDFASLGYAVNSSGHVAGISQPSVGSSFGIDAFFWNGISMQSIRMDIGFSATIEDMNDADVVVGSIEERAFFWRDGILEFLNPLPGGGFSVAAAINGDGHIVGRGLDRFGQMRAFYYDGTTAGDLNDWTRGLLDDGLWFSIALDINNRGEILAGDSSGRLHILTPQHVVPEGGSLWVIPGLLLMGFVFRLTK